MKKIITAMLFTAIALLMTACAEHELADGYQFGDFNKMAQREREEIKRAVSAYCDKNKDSAIRYAALNLIRLKYPALPENGICG